MDQADISIALAARRQDARFAIDPCGSPATQPEVPDHVLQLNNLADHFRLISLSDLGPAAGIRFPSRAVNDVGYVVGTFDTEAGEAHAYLRSPDGQISIDIGTLGGAFSIGVAINDANQVVGYSQRADGSVHAFRYTPAGPDNPAPRLEDLGTLGGQTSWASGINNGGLTVGAATLASPFDDVAHPHAFLFHDTLGMMDLNNVLPPDSSWTLVQAMDIDDGNPAMTVRGFGLFAGAARGFELTLQPMNAPGADGPVPTLCPSDFTSDGFVNSQDLFEFLSRFLEQRPSADFDRSGFIDSQDFFAFIQAYLAGC
ncbi:MAG: hypothetical protein H7210_03840 [Pyrinomonadaceae bacterium]|nr:hypothetical protein [Phycisphaerales bacterium]